MNKNASQILSYKYRCFCCCMSFRTSTKPDIHAANRRSYLGSLMFRAVVVEPESTKVSYDCKKPGADIFVTVKVSMRRNEDKSEIKID